MRKWQDAERAAGLLIVRSPKDRPEDHHITGQAFRHAGGQPPSAGLAGTRNEQFQ